MEERFSDKPLERQTLSSLQNQGFEQRGSAYFNGQPAFMIKYDGLRAVEVYIHSYGDQYRLSKAKEHNCLDKAQPTYS